MGSSCITYQTSIDTKCSMAGEFCPSGEVCAQDCAASGCSAKCKLYLVWHGTDKNDRAMLTSAEKFSELNKYSVDSMENSMSGVANSGCQYKSAFGGGCDGE